MPRVPRKEAIQHIDELLKQAAQGEEVIIEDSDGRRYTLTASTPPSTSRRTFGSARGQGWMSDDFDEPLEDFQEYME